MGKKTKSGLEHGNGWPVLAIYKYLQVRALLPGRIHPDIFHSE